MQEGHPTQVCLSRNYPALVTKLNYVTMAVMICHVSSLPVCTCHKGQSHLSMEVAS